MKQTNWLALLISIIIGMALGFLWYGALFMEQWSTVHNIVVENDIFFKNGNQVESSPIPMILNFVGLIFYSLILNWLIRKTEMWGFLKGAIIGLTVGTVACIDIILNNLFAFNPSIASLIDGSYIVVILTVMGGIIGAWRKK